MTNEWTAARSLRATARCDAAPKGTLAASAGNIWPDPDLRPRENQVDPVAACYGPNSDAFALAEFFAAARDDLPAALAWTNEVCAALGCAPEDAAEKVREMTARLAAWTAPVDVQKTVDSIVMTAYNGPPLSPHDVGELARPHVEKALRLTAEVERVSVEAYREYDSLLDTISRELREVDPSLGPVPLLSAAAAEIDALRTRAASWLAPVDVETLAAKLAQEDYRAGCGPRETAQWEDIEPAHRNTYLNRWRPHVAELAKLRRETRRIAAVCADALAACEHATACAKGWFGVAKRIETERDAAILAGAPGANMAPTKATSGTGIGTPVAVDDSDAPYSDVETLLTAEEKREAYQFGKVTGIGFASAKQVIADVKTRRAGVGDGATCYPSCAAAQSEPTPGERAAYERGRKDAIEAATTMLRAEHAVGSIGTLDFVARLLEKHEAETANERRLIGPLSVFAPVLAAPHSSALGDDGCGCDTCNKRQP